MFTVIWDEVTIAEDGTESVTPNTWPVVATTGAVNVPWYVGYSGKSFPPLTVNSRIEIRHIQVDPPTDVRLFTAPKAYAVPAE